jgi:hypothetical protein
MTLKEIGSHALTVSILLFVQGAFTQATLPANPGQSASVPRHNSVRPGYVGDQACAGCHRKEFQSYEHTGHKLTSQPASRESILGNFSPGANVLTISNPAINPSLPALFFKMEATAKGFSETAVTGWGTDLQKRSEHIDVVTGSGTRGQTYLYWQGDRLFELPVSYWTDGKRWVNSPGYDDGTADFSRPINPGCLECHATYVRALSSDVQTNSYAKESLVTGISCEICHGPGAEHVAEYAGNGAHNPNSTETKIVNPGKLDRDRQIDGCALCHSGTQRDELSPAFSYVPGKKLSDYFRPLSGPAVEHPDVHGNQVGLLQRSRCYQSSKTLTCSTCHDVHSAERPAASYSSRCLTCHEWTSCGVSKTLGHSIANNCIDCHMPVESTSLIVSETAGKVVRAKMRNHWIKVYPASQKR